MWGWIMAHLNTTSEVIDALGGTAAVARLMGVSLQVVTNWRARKQFPAYTYLGLKEALGERNVPNTLWRFYPRRTKHQMAAE